MSIFKFFHKIIAPEVGFSRGAVAFEKGLWPVRTAVAVFDPTANTGERTIAAHDLEVYIPDNAIIIGGGYDVITTFTTAGADAGTIKLGLETQDDAAFVAAIAVSDGTDPWDAGLHGILVGTPILGAEAAHDTALELAVLKAASQLKTTAERQLVATVATQALTAGKLILWLNYIISA